MSRRAKKKAPIVVQQGAPEWMVTFGDLMSLLLTFFVLLFSVSEIKEEKLYDVVTVFRELEQDIEGEFGLFSDLLEFLNSSSDPMADSSDLEQGQDAESLDEPYQEKEAPEKTKEDWPVDIEESVLFEPGSATLSKQGAELITKLGNRLIGARNRVRIIGFATPAHDHDEVTLAFQRARIVESVLVESGVNELRLDVTARHNSRLNIETLNDPNRLADRDRVIVILTPEYVEGLPAEEEPNSVPNGEVGRKNR